jgi:hypothetical protein
MKLNSVYLFIQGALNKIKKFSNFKIFNYIYYFKYFSLFIYQIGKSLKLNLWKLFKNLKNYFFNFNLLNYSKKKKKINWTINKIFYLIKKENFTCAAPKSARQ